MRLLELHLDRFGCFTDRRIRFRPDAALTVIYGPNEAGKTTALAGITDVLYGIEPRSSFDFLHRYPDMRLGATIAGEDGKRLEFRRRKGNQNTLLDEFDAPLADDALAGFLGSVDRALFLDAFGLDRKRLRDGAQRLIDGGGRVGESLLAAAPGLSSLVALRSQLAAEAEALFPAGRKVSSRPFWQACERHSEARKRVRQESLQADTVGQAHSDRDEAAEAVRQLRQEQGKLRAELSRLGRLRHALPRLRRIDDLESERTSLGRLPDVGPDFPARCRTALDDRRALDTEAQRLDQEIAAVKAKLDALSLDDALLDMADTVDRLTDQRATVVKAAEDLPRRQAELERARAELDEFARRLGLADHAGLLARRPPDTAVARARNLLTLRRRLRDQREERREALSGVVFELDALARRREVLGHVADPAPLRRQLDGLADLPVRIEACADLARNLAAHRSDIDDRLRRLVVPVASADELARLAVPDLASIDQAIERFDSLEKRRSELATECRRLAAEAAGVERRISALKADGDVPTADALNQARRERDEAWRSLRPRLIGEPGPLPLPDEVAAYEAAVVRTDSLADRRQAEADRIAEDRSLRSEQAEVESSMAVNAQALAELEARATIAATDWSGLWSPSELTPKSPREMRAWLLATAEILRLRRDLSGEQSRHDEVAGKLSRLTGQLHKLAHTLGIEVAGDPADVLKSTAAAISALETASENARLISREREGCERRQREFQAALDELDRQEAEWRTMWCQAAGAVGLRDEAGDEEAETALGIWQAVPALEAAMRDLQHRIGRIEQDRAGFAKAAAELCAAVAPDLGADPVAASAALRQRLVEARRAAAMRTGLGATLAELEDRSKERRRHAQLNQTELAKLCAGAGLAEPDELGALAQRIEQDAKLSGELAQERKALTDGAEGLGEAELRSELVGTNPDSLLARLQELADSQDELEARLGEAIRNAALAETRLEDIEARAGAAGAAQDEQNALAEVASIVEAWTGIAAAEKLLSAAIEAYRAQHQNPLIDRVSQAFAVATGNGFPGISLDFDDADSQRIVAVRADGERLGVHGLSEGTADQLFLALRIATIEDHARRARPLPFIADDLFVTFDDTRTKAGLTLLAELGQTTQTIVFTHHQHVVEAARHALGNRVETIDLG